MHMQHHEQMTSEPILIDTATAVVFILKMRGQTKNPETARSARKHIYHLAECGKLTNHGAGRGGKALWDLRELAKPYRN